MDIRLPIAIALGVGYAIWLALRALKDPSTSEKRLNSLARYALLWGIGILGLTVLAYIGHVPVADILLAKIPRFRAQGAIAFSYVCLGSSVVFWLAASRARS
jgi:hypothetical protein